MIWYKQGVCGSLQPPARKALGRVAVFAAVNDEDVFVTSIRDGNHSLGSLHPDGYAWDMRPLRRVSLAKAKELCGEDFDVINEGNHWHLEYDPKA